MLVGIGSLTSGAPVTGAPPSVQIYLAQGSVLLSNLLLADGSGNASSSLAIPPVNGLLGLPVVAQVVAFDPTLSAAVPIGSSQGMAIVVGN